MNWPPIDQGEPSLTDVEKTHPRADIPVMRRRYEVRYLDDQRDKFRDFDLACQWAQTLAADGAVVDVVEVLPFWGGRRFLTAYPESELAARGKAWADYMEYARLTNTRHF